MKRYGSIFTFSICILLVIASCKKESSKHCRVIVDNLGNDLTHVCNKTESELVDCVNNNSCGINLGFTITSCNYYNEDAEKFCYMVNGRYTENLNESLANLYKNCYSLTVQKVDCGFCKKWYNREKRIYKPTNATFYSSIRSSDYCGDTLSTLYQGRQIIRKNDADSLISIQFSNNGIDW